MYMYNFNNPKINVHVYYFVHNYYICIKTFFFHCLTHFRHENLYCKNESFTAQHFELPPELSGQPALLHPHPHAAGPRDPSLQGLHCSQITAASK